MTVFPSCRSSTTGGAVDFIAPLLPGAKSRTKPRDFQIPFLFQLASKMVGAIMIPCALNSG